MEIYTELPWEFICQEVAKLRVELPTGKVLPMPLAAAGRGKRPL